MALQITDANFEELVNSGKPMVLDFWAEWCGPCRMVSPIIDELETEYEGRVTIGKMNVDENDDVVGRFGIRNIPTVLFFKDGKMVDKVVGATAKDKFVEKIKEQLPDELKDTYFTVFIDEGKLDYVVWSQEAGSEITVTYPEKKN